MTQCDFNRNILEIIGDICCRLEADPNVRVKYSDLVTRIGNVTRAQATEAARDAAAFGHTGEYAPVPDENAPPPDHDPPVAAAPDSNG
jgi:hypothetical protein